MPIIIGFGGIKSRVNPSNLGGTVLQRITYRKTFMPEQQVLSLLLLKIGTFSSHQNYCV